MASVTNKKQIFEPIIIEIDGKEIEICACGQTKNEDRTCDGTHKILNAQIENGGADAEKTMTVEEVLTKLNAEDQSDEHQCSCGGHCSNTGQSCGCRGH